MCSHASGGSTDGPFGDQRNFFQKVSPDSSKTFNKFRIPVYAQLLIRSGEALLKSLEGMGSGEGKLFPKVSLPQPPEAFKNYLFN
ncbi:hypothetical protein D0S45_09525 [Marinifilum sp. JC120]|nr:hypothetical protein D0S45_09525 [Marinifilum sp. JC120]